MVAIAASKVRTHRRRGQQAHRVKRCNPFDRQASPIEGSRIFFVRVSRLALHEVGLTTHKPYVLADDDKMRIFSTSDLANKKNRDLSSDPKTT